MVTWMLWTLLGGVVALLGVAVLNQILLRELRLGARTAARRREEAAREISQARQASQALGEQFEALRGATAKARPSEVRLRAADLGIALAERMSKIQRGPAGEKRLTSDDKVKIAVAFAVEHALKEEVPLSDAEARKTIEARLEQLTGSAS